MTERLLTDEMGAAVLERVQIETVHGCNASCAMCPVETSQRQRKPMAPEVFSEALRQLAGLTGQLKVLALYAHGEPLLDRHLEDRIRLSKDAGFANVGFTTNGSLLNPQRAISLLDAGPDWIAFSFESLDKATFEGIRIGLHFETVLENITKFIDARNARGDATRISMRFISQDVNEQEFESYLRFFGDRLNRDTDEIRFIASHNWALGTAANSSSLAKPCPFLFDRCVILQDGTVPLCCVDFAPRYSLGNIMDTPLSEIWNGSQWRQIRQLHTSSQHGQMEMCATCDVMAGSDEKKYRMFSTYPGGKLS